MEEKLFIFDDFEWKGKKKIRYKAADESGAASFLNVTRQNLFSGNLDTFFDLRYFECESHGHTTLEKHEHEHVVVVLRGEGKIIAGREVYKVKPFDMIRIPSWNFHQLINTGEQPFGFLCIVNNERDSYQLLTSDEAEELQKNDEIKKAIKIPEGYFNK